MKWLEVTLPWLRERRNSLRRSNSSKYDEMSGREIDLWLLAKRNRVDDGIRNKDARDSHEKWRDTQTRCDLGQLKTERIIGKT